MNRTLKKVISIIVLIVVFLSGPLSRLSDLELLDLYGITAKAAESGTCGENLTWILNTETGVLEIDGFGDMKITSSAPWYQFASKIKQVSIGDEVTSIGAQAFYGCTNLTDVDIPSSINTIDNGAFRFCTSLTEIYIPANVTLIKEYVFNGATNLSKITVDTQNPNYSSDEYGILFNKDKTILLQYPEGNKATKYVIPNSVVEIYAWAFEYCENLSDIIIGENVSTIGMYSFRYCKNLEGIYIPQNVTKIKFGAFDECNNLSYVIFSKGINEIDSSVFWNCSNLDTVYYEGTEEEWANVSIDICNDSLSKANFEFEYKYTHKHYFESSTLVDATCATTGKQLHICFCGYNYITETEKNNNHSIIIDEAIAPTCTQTGLTEGQHCSRCDDMTIEQEVVPTKSHAHTAKYNSEKHWKECVCGSIIEEQNHSFVDGNVCSCGYERKFDVTIAIKNNNGSRTINYGETLELTAIVSNVANAPENAVIAWYVDGVNKGEGETFRINFESGTKTVEVKLVDENGVVYQDATKSEISDSENVTVKAGFFQKLISFFKNLFRISRIILQSI